MGKDSYLQAVYTAHLQEHGVKRLKDLPKHIQKALTELAQESGDEQIE